MVGNWIPKQWRKAYIVLLAKNAKTDFLNYWRPITLAQTESKIFTAIHNLKLMNYLKKNKILEELQYGSRRQRSAAQALVTLKSVIDDAHLHEINLYVMYLDFAKAYDSVEHEMLERTMKYYDIPNEVIDQIMDMYKDNEAKVFTPHGKTRKIRVTNGVKQGDTLSPLLFIMFINPLLTKLRESGKGYRFTKNKNIHIPNVTYSYNNTLITSTKQDMEELVKIVEKFCEDTGIRLNPSKCIYTYKVHSSEETHKVKINGEEINMVE